VLNNMYIHSKRVSEVHQRRKNGYATCSIRLTFFHTYIPASQEPAQVYCACQGLQVQQVTTYSLRPPMYVLTSLVVLWRSKPSHYRTAYLSSPPPSTYVTILSKRTDLRGVGNGLHSLSSAGWRRMPLLLGVGESCLS
jgi:hypothetical protein